MAAIDRSRLLQRLLRRVTRRGVYKQRVAGEVQRIVTLPKTHVDAAKSLVDKETWQKPRIRRTTTEKHDYVRTHPDIIEFAKAFQKEMDRRKIPFRPFQFYRGWKEQAARKMRGVSKAGPGQSPHQYGCAVDFIHATKAWDITPKQWAVIGAIGYEVARKRNIDIEWGGEWKFYDPAHWQLADWRKYMVAHDLLEELDTPLNTMSDAHYFSALDQAIKQHKL